MASEKKALEGIALLSMYGDEDDEMKNSMGVAACVVRPPSASHPIDLHRHAQPPAAQSIYTATLSHPPPNRSTLPPSATHPHSPLVLRTVVSQTQQALVRYFSASFSRKVHFTVSAEDSRRSCYLMSNAPQAKQYLHHHPQMKGSSVYTVLHRAAAREIFISITHRLS